MKKNCLQPRASQNGVYEVILKEIGNLELMCRDTPFDTLLSSSNTEKYDVDVFKFLSNGNLVIRKLDGTYIWKSNKVYNYGPLDRFILQNEGNLVLHAGSVSKWTLP